VPLPPTLPAAKPGTVEGVLAAGPATYLDLMAALGTRDGREILPILEKLYASGKLGRLEDGRYTLNPPPPGPS
jgi:hypothetical protein